MNLKRWSRCQTIDSGSFPICTRGQLQGDTSALEFYKPKEFEDPMLSKTLARQPSGAPISRTWHLAEKDDAKIS